MSRLATELFLAASSYGKKAPQLTVLFAPAHTRIDESEGGSEYYWSYKLIEKLAVDYGVRCIALTIQPHVEQTLPGVQFISVNPDGHLPVSNVDSLLFHFRCYRASRRILASGQHIDVIHHMLPFGFRATFNVLALEHRHADPPLVIGPLQAPLSFSNADEGSITAREFTDHVKPIAPVRHHRGQLPLATFLTTPILSALSAQTLKRSAACVAISERAARLYRSYSGIEAFTIIPPGVDTEQFIPIKRQGVNTSEGQPSRVVTIVAVGYLIRRKAFDVLIKAIAKLIEMQLPVRLHLVGDGPARSDLEKLTSQLGVEEHVEFAGRIPHSAIGAVYQQSDIFCSTSLSEGFSTVCLEALASGLPIVATPTGGFREVLEQYHVGTLVPFGTVDELARAIAELVTQQSLRESLGQRAREVAIREYDWHIIAQQYLDVYKGVM